MRPADLDAVLATAAIVHPAYPEDRAVFADRIARFPQGCLCLEREGAVVGYLVSHPARQACPPKLNAATYVAPDADCYYIHDLALLASARGMKAASAAIALAVAIAREHGFGRLALIAVNGSAPFWAAHGFQPAEPRDDAIQASYGADALLMTRDTVR